MAFPLEYRPVPGEFSDVAIPQRIFEQPTAPKGGSSERLSRAQANLIYRKAPVSRVSYELLGAVWRSAAFAGRRFMSNQLLRSVVLCICSLAAISTASAEIRIGIAGPQTGRNQFTGEQQLVGAQKAIDTLNASGGLLGQQVMAVTVDDACDAKQAEAAARQLIAERVVAVIGHICSAASIAAQRLYDDAGIVMITPGSTNPKVTDEGSPNTFRVIGRDDQQGMVAADYLADTFSKDRIAILNDGSVYGAGLASETRKHLNDRGIREVSFGSYSPGQSDYSTVVQQLRSMNVRVLFVGGYSSDIAIIARQAKQQIPDLQLVSGDTLATADFLLTAGASGEGAVFTFGPDIRRRPEAASVVANFTKDGYDPGGKTLYSFAAVQVWSEAVRRAGSTRMPDVVAALRTGTFETVLGRIGFDAKGDITGTTPFVLYRMGKDNFAPIE